MIEFDPEVNYGKDAIPAESFELQLKSYRDAEGTEKKFFVLDFETPYGEAKFILLPEELNALVTISRRSLEGIELREEFKPRIRDVSNMKEMFPDI